MTPLILLSSLALAASPGGVGIQLDVWGEPDVILWTYKGLPAAGAGLGHGDRLIAVGGKPAKGADAKALLSRLKGPVGSDVELTVLRLGAAAPATLTLRRAELASVPTLIERARIEKGVRSGLAASRYLKGQGQLFGWHDYPKDAPAGILVLEEAAAQGHSEALATLASVYNMGKDAPRDDEKAFLYAGSAAEKGNPTGMQFLGNMYRVGRGVAADPAKSHSWSLRAAELGDVTAGCAAAYNYANGAGVEPDAEQAWYWARKTKAAPCGQYWMGVLLENGLGTEQDAQTALEWYRKAAQGGHRDAALKAAALAGD